MEIDEDMEAEPVFEAHEVDIDYEFEAARFFDFTREETQREASQAEIWFESAKSYPPSPFVTKLILGEDFLMGNVNVSPKPNRENPSSSLYGGYHVGEDQRFYGKDVNNGDCEVMERGIFGNLQKVLNHPYGVSTGLHNYLSSNKPKGKTKSTMKASLPRSSTLMKPTVSQLAKQNHFLQAGSFRFQMPHIQNNEKSLCSSSGVEHQAPKRQKLEGGHLLKVTDGKEQTNFVHKVPKKDEILDKIPAHAKLRLTIPREPELETAQRAHRIRNGTELKEVTSTVRRFKARPFNRKIFEAPSLPLPKRSTPKLPEFQVFHLKTTERAKQNAPTVSFSNLCKDSDKLEKPSTSYNVEDGNRETRRQTTTEVLKQDGDGVHRFKALPLNKKIFSSKGDIGIFRNSKREATVPMGFNFHTERRIQQNPPTDLFSKLSLTSEFKPDKGSQVKLPRSNSLAVEDSKENGLGNLQTEDKMTVKSSTFSRKQVVCGSSDGGLSEISNKLHTRSWGIH